MANAPELEVVTHTPDRVAFTYYVASWGFNYYTAFWTDIYEGEPVYIQIETNPESLQYDRFACSIKRITRSRGLLYPTFLVVGHVPL